MQPIINIHPAKQKAIILCLILGPLLQLIGDSLWVSGNHPFSWNLWREASYLFFIPVGFLLSKVVERKNVKWAIAACALFIIGCLGSATMMPLFRLGAFYPVAGHNEFPIIVQSAFDKNAFAATLFLPGLCLPVSFVLFGILYLKYKLLLPALASSFCVAGILFWTGNAEEINTVLIAGDAWLLAVFGWFGYIIFRKQPEYKNVVLSGSYHK